jgi:hypothetical protein
MVMKAFFLATLPKLVFVSVFLVAVAGFVGTAPARTYAGGTPTCVTTFVHAYEKLDATGMWNCFTPEIQKNFYKGAGWTGDADLQKAIFAADKKAEHTIKVTLFSGNPTCDTPLGSNAKVCNAWIMWVAFYDKDGTALQACGIFSCQDEAFSLTVFINGSGKV